LWILEEAVEHVSGIDFSIFTSLSQPLSGPGSISIRKGEYFVNIFEHDVLNCLVSAVLKE